MMRGIGTVLLIVVLAACGKGDDPQAEKDLSGKGPVVFALRLVYKAEDPAAIDECAAVVCRRVMDSERRESSVEFKKLGSMLQVGFRHEPPREYLERVKRLCLRKGSLEFVPVAVTEIEAAERAKREREGSAYTGPPQGFRWLPCVEGSDDPERLLEIAESTWTGADLDPAELKVQPDVHGFGFLVAFGIVESRQAEFGAFTASIRKRQLAIVLDGKVETAPVVHERLPGRGIISGGAGGFSRDEALDLQAVLSSGKLPCKLELISEERPPPK